ncbi:MAG TPA: hypothetical protein VMZ30_14540, partial [Pyrinomonadaceae bacterium]|nr:hypothetical protein [Pyrinomonadaceae bacterium]
MVRTRLALVLAALAFGCDDFATSPAPQSSAIAPTLLRPPANTVDSAFLAMTREIPGFAGLYFDNSGNVNVMLMDTTRGGLAARRVAQFISLYRG